MKENTHINVNPSVLKWARESIVFTKNQASENSGISVKQLEKLENGESKPTIHELKQLSKTYKRTIANLLLLTPPQEPPLPKDRRTVDSTEIGNFDEKTILAVRKARALAEALVELKEDVGVSQIKFTYNANINDNPRQIAQIIRKDLNITEVKNITNHNQALDAYIEKVELTGVAVFQLSMTKDNLRGFSLVNEKVPVIAIKRGGEPTTAKIFTLFHELGHIILHEGGICDIDLNANTQQIEKWCNTFAAEVLIPSQELTSNNIVKEYIQANNFFWSKKDLIEIANTFHVGPLAILRQLLEHKLTTTSFYKEKHDAWNKPSFGRSKTPEGRNVAKETLKEKGRYYISLAFKAFDQNKIDLKDLSDFLGVKLTYISKTRRLLNS